VHGDSVNRVLAVAVGEELVLERVFFHGDLGFTVFVAIDAGDQHGDSEMEEQEMHD
jgi:hypothetical protein